MMLTLLPFLALDCIVHMYIIHFHIVATHPLDDGNEGKNSAPDLNISHSSQTETQTPSGDDEPCDDVHDKSSVTMPCDYYTIALLGKSGQGKSTTGNKLLQIDNTTFESKDAIKEWKCSDPAALKCSSTNEPKLGFISGEGAESVTKQCQMLSNEDKFIRVLDVPGFADSKSTNKTTVHRNAALIHSVGKIQKEFKIQFHRILYFLPNRGRLVRSDAYMQDELKTLFFYFGDSVFKCMVIIATKDEGENPGFTDTQFEKMRKTVLYTMQEVTHKEHPICPPIVYLPFDATPAELLIIVKEAPVESESALDHCREDFQVYSCDDEWETWIQQFESCANSRSLDNKSKLEMMKTLLTGVTKVAFDKIAGEDFVQYDSAIEQLRKHIYSARYEARKKKNGEEWKDFVGDLCKLAKNAFPDKQPEQINEMVIANFQSQAVLCVKHLQLPDQLFSLDTIVTIVTATEAIPVAYTAEDMGKGWLNWIAHFDKITTSLDVCTKLHWLNARLAGKALIIFDKLSFQNCGDFQQAKEIFCRKLFTSLFEESEKRQTQRWDSYAEELKSLAKMGYPMLQSQESESVVLNRILSQVKNQTLKERQWTTLNEAVITIAATEEIPDEYDDETGQTWTAWLAKFNMKCGIADNKQRLQWLKVRISDRLLPLFQMVCNEMKDDFVQVISSFHASLVSMAMFKSRTKLPSESWKELSDDLVKLATKCFPMEERENVVLMHFLSIIQKPLSYFKLSKSPESLFKAVIMVSGIEAVQQLEKYSGDTEWDQWLRTFESALISNGEWVLLTEVDIVEFLRSRLELKALSVFEKLSPEQLSTYQKAKDTFCSELYVYLFQSSEKRQAQRWDTYADELKFMADKGYPHVPIQEREDKVLRHILCQVKNPSLKDRYWNTLSQAVMVITATEEIPNAYDDDTGNTWESWLENFNLKCGIADNKQKLQWLKVRISGNLLPAFDRVCKMKNDDYIQITESFHESLTSLIKFKNRTKLASESWNELCDDLVKLSTKYVPTDEQDNVVLMHFLSIIQDNFCDFKLFKSPETLLTAVTMVSGMEMVLNLEKYSGGDWEQWLTKFESSLISNEEWVLTEVDMVEFLRSRLESKALSVFDKLSTDQRATYQMAKDTFCSELYIFLFQSSEKRQAQRWDTYAGELKFMVDKGYHYLPLQEREDMVLKHILCQVKNVSLKNRHWNSLNEAVTVITATDEIPNEYDDDTGQTWHSWLEDFNLKCGITDIQERLQWLNIRISAKLKPLFDTVYQERKDDFVQVTKSFHEAVLMERVRSRHKLPSENWRQLYDCLCLLAKGIVPAEKQEKFILQHYLLIIDKHGVNLTLFKKPETCSEAVALVSAIEVVQKLQKYSGIGNWKQWIIKFQSALQSTGSVLTEDVKVSLLRSCLISKALAAFESLSCDKIKYVEVVQTEIAILLFRHRVKQHDENWKQFAHDLGELAECAYPDMQDIERNKEVLEHFLSDQMMNDDVRNKDPETIDVAIDLINAMRVITKYSGQEDLSWEQWIAYFEAKVTEYNIQKIPKVLWVCLSGKSRTVFEEKNIIVHCRSYPEAKFVLQTELYKVLFEYRVLLLNEPLDEFLENLESLAFKAYPKIQNVESIVLKRFLADAKMNNDVRKMNPETIKVAHDIITAIKVIEQYSGQDSIRWDQWICYFESKAKQSNINMTSKVLCVCLSGKARMLFDLKVKDYTTSYADAKYTLQTELYKEWFKTRVLKESEGLGTFRDDLQLLAKMAYPDKQPGERQNLVLKQFLQDPQMNNDVQNMKPETIEVAIDIITAMQVIAIYSGQDDISWEQWVQHFENQAKEYNIHMTSKVLCVCLNGNPRDIYNEKVDINAPYEDAKCVLQEELYKRLLELRFQKENEFFDDFVDDLNLLANKAYPKSSPGFVDGKVLMKLKSIQRDVEWDPDIFQTTGGFILTLNIAGKVKSCEDMDWDEWIAHFENVVAEPITELTCDDYAKLQCFEACLSGDAKKLYENSPYYRKDYNNATNDVRAKLYTKMFMQRRRRNNESWKQLSNSLRKIAKKAYPDDREADIDKKVLSRFLQLVNKAVKGKNPLCTEEAITLQEFCAITSKGIPLNFLGCTKCLLRTDENNRYVQDEDGNCIIPHSESKCHGEMIDRYGKLEKAIGGTVHLLTLGVVLLYGYASGNRTFAGYTNDEKMCHLCRSSLGSAGCQTVGYSYESPIEDSSGQIYTTVAHNFIFNVKDDQFK